MSAILSTPVILSADRGSVATKGKSKGPREYFVRPCRFREFSRQQKALAWIAIIPLISRHVRRAADGSHGSITHLQIQICMAIARCGTLAMCRAALACPAGRFSRSGYSLATHAPANHAAGLFSLGVPKRDFFLTSVAALNIPAEAIQLPYAVFTPSKQEWVPQGVDFRVWRVVTWPLLCIPFWWLAGRAIDALVAVKSVRFAPRIGWPETIIGFILMAAFGTAFCGLVFGLPKEDRTFELTRFVAGCGLWVLLGALSVIARFRQWRFIKKHKAII
jgi:hypothetical protein